MRADLYIDAGRCAPARPRRRIGEPLIMETQDHVDENVPEAKGKTPRTRRKASAKAPTDNGKRSLNLRIDQDSYRRLSIHALMRDSTISDLVMEFAQTLRDWSMPHRIGAGSARTEPEE
jgi:hypothetical protein